MFSSFEFSGDKNANSKTLMNNLVAAKSVLLMCSLYSVAYRQNMDVLLNYYYSVSNIANCSHRDSKKTCLRGPIYKGCSERNMLYGMGSII